MAKKTDVKPTPTHATHAKPKAEKAEKAGSSKGARERQGGELDDPALLTFGEALKALHQKDWSRAVELFGRTIEESDRPELTARARQFRTAAEKQLPQAPPAAGAEADPFVQALVEKNRGNFKAALDLAKKGGRDKKDERFLYLVAAIHALENRTDEAVQALSQAIELNPKNRIHAFHDADFADLRKNRDHRHLFGLS
jgi:tetratricopeptide (TPR) repeat protein